MEKWWMMNEYGEYITYDEISLFFTPVDEVFFVTEWTSCGWENPSTQ